MGECHHGIGDVLQLALVFDTLCRQLFTTGAHPLPILSFHTHRAQSTIRHFVVAGLHVARKLTVSVTPRLSKLFLCDSDQPIDCAMGVCQAVITSSRQSSHRTVTYLIVRSRRTGWIATLEMVFPEFYIQYKQGHYSVNNIRKSSIEIKSQPREGQERNR